MACIALVGFGFAVSSLAADTDPVDLATLRSQQVELRADVSSGNGVYEDMSKSKREELLERQQRVLDAIGDKQSMSELDGAQLDAVTEDLAWIDRAVQDAEDNRMVCERRKKLGSNRTERVCMTVAQQREMRERARSELQRSGVCADCGGDG